MVFQINLYSEELKKETSVSVLLPEAGERPHKVIWLLHGLGGNHTSWLTNTRIARYAKQHRLAVVMPNADRSWYTNTAYNVNYFNYIAHELPILCRRIFAGFSEKREDNVVAGLSMGGYGALKLALTCPEQYGACISLSGSLDVTRRGRTYDPDEWRSIFGLDIDSPLSLAGGQHDLFALAARDKASHLPFPSIFLWCGTEDSLIDINRDFSKHLTALDVPHVFEASEGDHTWKWWDLQIEEALDSILKAPL